MAVFFASKTGTVSRFHRELCSSTRKEGKLTKGRVTDRRPDGPSASKPLGHGQCTLRPRREAAAHALDDVRGKNGQGHGRHTHCEHTERCPGRTAGGPREGP